MVRVLVPFVNYVKGERFAHGFGRDPGFGEYLFYGVKRGDGSGRGYVAYGLVGRRGPMLFMAPQ